MIWCYEAKQDERQLLTHWNTLTTPVLVTDLNQRILGCNRNWELMCRYTAEEAFGQTPASCRAN